MPATAKRSRARSAAVVYIPIERIVPNPVQPRKTFSPAAMEELAQSIREYGVLTPLSVRRREGGYELIAGERRLRAARMAGLGEVPCLVLDVDLEESGLIALVENLQRQDLDFIEEAEGIAQLIRVFGMSQEEAARRLGKSQSAVANKLRLLKLSSDVLDTLRQNGLTERHGRALLRLPTGVEQRAALDVIVEKKLTVAATDAYIDRLLAAPPPGSGKRKLFVLKDVRIFLNTLSHSLDVMKQGGIQAAMKRQETENALILTISIPKKKS